MASSLTSSFTQVQRVRLLYKTILRLHRGLPLEMKAIGDQYVREEFKRHKTCQPQEGNIFMAEWVDYTVTLAKQLGVKSVTRSQPNLGRSLTANELNFFRDEQVSQLYDLMLEAKKPRDSPHEEDEQNTR